MFKKIKNLSHNLPKQLTFFKQLAPPNPISKLLLTLNAAFYTKYFFSRDIDKMKLQYHELHKPSLLTCHFYHDSITRCLLDSGIIYVFSSALVQMTSVMNVAKICALSMATGTLFTLVA